MCIRDRLYTGAQDSQDIPFGCAGVLYNLAPSSVINPPLRAGRAIRSEGEEEEEEDDEEEEEVEGGR
eukprot:5941515-Pyramimonas_sp.AAC.1